MVVDKVEQMFYDVATSAFGVLTCAEHLSVRDGKIWKDRLTFDTYAIRTAQAG